MGREWQIGYAANTSLVEDSGLVISVASFLLNGGLNHNDVIPYLFLLCMVRFMIVKVL